MTFAPGTLILAALLIALHGAPVAAQMACGERDAVVAKLGEKYGEVRRGGGLAGSMAIFELWASDEPPYTWTILRSHPNGLTCIMAVGDNWQDDGWQDAEPSTPGEPT